MVIVCFYSICFCTGPQGKGRGKSGRQEQPVWFDPDKEPWEPESFDFTALPGPRGRAADEELDTPADYLELFLTDELLQMIVDQTNLYADQYISANVTTPGSRVKDWTALSVRELKAFLGLLFLTGIVSKPELAMFWSTNELYATPYFGRVMSRNRFQLILKFLHFTNNTTADTQDKLYKIRPVLDYLVGKFQELFQPDVNVSIDEGTLLWRGRLSFKVYNPQKPIRYGIRSYILADSATGYCHNIIPYCGDHVALADTVVNLVGSLRGQGYRLYMDNFYNSVKLSEQLLKMKTHVCGTLRRNRGEPPEVRAATVSDLAGGEKVIALHNTRVMTLAWKDTNVVRMVTTFHDSNMGSVTVWSKKQKARVEKTKPVCVMDYNLKMNGVDRLDQNLSYYAFVRKCYKWSNKMVLYLLQISLYNSFVLYKAMDRGPHRTMMDFLGAVIRSWTCPTRHARAIHPAGGLVDNPPHPLVRVPPTDGKERPSRPCFLCYRDERKRRESRFMCAVCGVTLCRRSCFALYHAGLNIPIVVNYA